MQYQSVLIVKEREGAEDEDDDSADPDVSQFSFDCKSLKVAVGDGPGCDEVQDMGSVSCAPKALENLSHQNHVDIPHHHSCFESTDGERVDLGYRGTHFLVGLSSTKESQ